MKKSIETNKKNTILPFFTYFILHSGIMFGKQEMLRLIWKDLRYRKSARKLILFRFVE